MFNMKTNVAIILTIIFYVRADRLEDLDLRENVRFFLYTRDGVDDPRKLYVDDEQSIKISNYNISKDTKFYTPAFNKSYLDDDSSLIRKAFLKVEDYNVIVVDWSQIAQTLTHEEVVGHTKLIGRYIAKFVDFLMSLGSDPKRMSLVGDSLGAHLVGSAGYLAAKKVGHVVGLDPIRTGFDTVDLESRISTESATVVEVIHTSDGSLVQQGHLDFYPNGGKVQLGCENSTSDCAHNRAHEYYAETLTIAKNWLAVQCDDYEAFLREDYRNRPIVSYPFSFGLPKVPRGIYFSRTAASAPYGLGFRGLSPSL